MQKSKNQNQVYIIHSVENGDGLLDKPTKWTYG